VCSSDLLYVARGVAGDVEIFGAAEGKTISL